MELTIEFCIKVFRSLCYRPFDEFNLHLACVIIYSTLTPLLPLNLRSRSQAGFLTFMAEFCLKISKSFQDPFLDFDYSWHVHVSIYFNQSY